MKLNEELHKSLLQKLFNSEGLPKNDISYGDLTKEEFDYFMKKVATSLTIDIYRNSVIEDFHSELEELTNDVMKEINIDICDRMYVKVLSGSSFDQYIPYMFIAAFGSPWNEAEWLEPSVIPYMLDIAIQEYIMCEQAEDGLDYIIEIIAKIGDKPFMFHVEYDYISEVFAVYETDDIINDIFNGDDTFFKDEFYEIMRNATEFSYSIEITD